MPERTPRRPATARRAASKTSPATPAARAVTTKSPVTSAAAPPAAPPARKPRTARAATTTTVDTERTAAPAAAAAAPDTKPAARTQPVRKPAVRTPAVRKPVVRATAVRKSAARTPAEQATTPVTPPQVHPEEGEIAVAPPRPAPRRPGLIPTEVADALSAVLGKATKAIRDHEAGSRSGGDIENVHQMRVATRRIRAYLKAAKPALDSASAEGIRADLGELAGALGQVRDLDVMIHRMHAEAAALGEPDTTAMERLIGSLDDDRASARRALVSQLDDPDHGALLDELDAAAHRPPVANPWADLSELAAKEYRKLAKGQRRLVKEFGDNPPDDDLHALRILGKRARYTAELLGKKAAVHRFLATLAHFQEVLGDHQDAFVLEQQLREMVAHTGDVEAALAAGRVIQGCRERRVQARKDYPAAWKAVAKAAEAAYGH